jgi:hypothetical protein
MVKHLTEEELQLYAMDPLQCTTDLVDHLNECPECQLQLASYHFLFSELSRQTKPYPQFDIREMVMLKVIPEPGAAADRFIAAFLIVFITGFVGVFIFAFRPYFFNLFGSLPAFFIYAIIAGTVAILSIYVIIMYKHFRSKMKFLNIH